MSNCLKCGYTEQDRYSKLENGEYVETIFYCRNCGDIIYKDSYGVVTEQHEIIGGWIVNKEYYQFSYGVYYGSSKVTKEDSGNVGVYSESLETAKQMAKDKVIKNYSDLGYEKVIVHSVLQEVVNYI